MTNSKKILMLSTEFGTEHDELTVPRQRLGELGHQVTLATPGGKPAQTVEGDKDWSEVIEADEDVAKVTGEFDVIVLPGGTVNADNGRMDADFQRLLKQQAASGRTIAAICHAPWLLIDADLAKGKQLTSYVSIRPDLENAGATWHDEALVNCGANGWTLLTSRNPGDLDAFVTAIDEL